MSGKTILFSIFKRFRASILITFSLLSLENVLMVLTPFVLGLAIDGLLDGDLMPTLLLGGLLLVEIVIGTGRRFYDTRCYGRIYAELASENAVNGWQAGRSISSLGARSEQLQEMVGFVEMELAQSYNAVIRIGGALVMLAIVDWRLLIGCLLAALLIFVIYMFSSEQIYRFNRGLNDQHDKQLSLLESRNETLARSHFRRITRWSIRLSDLEARNFALVDLVASILLLFSLWGAATGGNATPGSIFAILAYVLEFVEGSYLLPMAFQQFVRLNEIASRLTLSPAPSTEKVQP